MATPIVEPIQERIVQVAVANLARIDPANGSYWNVIGADEVYRWGLPPQGADRYPYWVVVDTQEAVAEGASDPSSANDLYSRMLTIVLEGVAKADMSDAVAPATVGWRLLADAETAMKANLKMEETLGNPATRLATDTKLDAGSVVVGFPSEPLVTVTRRVVVRYRTVRDDPYSPR